MNKLLLSTILLGALSLHGPLHAQANPAPASDDPMAAFKTPSKNTDEPSPFLEQFKGHLITMDHGTVKEVDVATLKNVKYWAFYQSASWCGPCKAFTPSLVEFYTRFKRSHQNFELVFVSADKDEKAMLAYMKDDRMPWLALKYSDRFLNGVNLGKYFGDGIPDLVLTDADGKVLADMFKGKDYLGPTQAMEQFTKLVPRSE